jgi:hypothetical protein
MRRLKFFLVLPRWRGAEALQVYGNFCGPVVQCPRGSGCQFVNCDHCVKQNEGGLGRRGGIKQWLRRRMDLVPTRVCLEHDTSCGGWERKACTDRLISCLDSCGNKPCYRESIPGPLPHMIAAAPFATPSRNARLVQSKAKATGRPLLISIGGSPLWLTGIFWPHLRG